MQDKAKLRYGVVEIMGDLYWKDTGKAENNIDYCFQKIPKECKDERDIEAFVNREIN